MILDANTSQGSLSQHSSSNSFPDPPLDGIESILCAFAFFLFLSVDLHSSGRDTDEQRKDWIQVSSKSQPACLFVCWSRTGPDELRKK